MTSCTLYARWFCALLCLPLLSGCAAAARRVVMAAEAAQYTAEHPGNYRVYYIPSASMLPTLHIGDTLLIDRNAYRHADPRRGDIVLFKPPIPSRDNFIKRIIAVPGDTFRINRGSVYVNGARVREPYVQESTAYDMQIRDYGIFVSNPPGRPSALDGPYADVPPHAQWPSADRVPAGCYIALGDNRNDSEDSHVFGCIEAGHITGKLVKVL